MPLIAGGGPAGAAAAIRLARGGARPVLVERTREAVAPVCGAFLGWDAVEALAGLGVEVASLGAQRIGRVRIIAGGRVLERRLPRPAAGLSRRALDAALLHRAAEEGAGVERGVAVRRVDGTSLHLADRAVLAGDALFLATGKHPLRGSPREGAGPGAVGLRAAGPTLAGLAGVIELHLFRGGYAGLLLQEDGSSNLCLSVAADRLAAAGSPAALLAAVAAEAPRLGDRLAAFAGPWSAIAGVPYGWQAAETVPGLFRLGDQAGVIASLAGDGVAVALSSAKAAATAYLAGGAAAAPGFQRRFRTLAARPIGLAERLRRGAERPGIAQALLAGPLALPGVLPLAARLTRIGA